MHADFPQPSELFIVGYDGTQLPDALRTRFSRGEYAGLIFFRRNFAQAGDARAIARQLDELGRMHKPTGDLRDLPPILSIDHEGGRVQRIKAPLTVWPPMSRLAAHPPAVAEQVGRAMARELLALGFNLNFAPVLDIHTNPQNPAIGDRAFGTTPTSATERALAFWHGFDVLGGVRGCGKHFPGHGDTATDSHHTLPVVNRSATELRTIELYPFAAAVRAGFEMLMTAHVVYPGVDTLPATLSARWLKDILRGQLGFDGVVVSDDLDMDALNKEHLAEIVPGAASDDGQLVVASLLAGCDAFLLCRNAERQARAEEALSRAATDRVDVRARLREAATRLRRFRSTLAPIRPDHGLVDRMPLEDHQALRDKLAAGA